MSIRLPRRVQNPISAIGAVIATTMAVLFLVLVLLESIGAITNPYAGLLVFVTVPLLFVLALLLIPLGMWWSARRRRIHPERADWPVIDLGQPRHRTIALIVGILTIVNIVVVSMAAYGGVHYMDSKAFCGQVCHVTMEPEFVASQVWPHARVECASCHIGPDVGAAVQAKMAGTRQLYHVLTNQIPRPVPAPDRLIRPASATCQQCHWSDREVGDRLRFIHEYANDEKNSETVTKLVLHVGAGRTPGRGIHWHADPAHTIEFVRDAAKPDVVPYVRVTDADGRVHEYVTGGTSTAPLAAAPRRRMDCMDCHNRPPHTMFATAERAVDTAVAGGRIPRDLPFVRREAIAALMRGYPDRAAGVDGIARQLTAFYSGRPSGDPQVRQVIATARDLWTHNVFPAMKVTWGTYANNLGHIDSPGCFRCHDDEHKTSDGRVISQSCELCHTAPE
jgi:nitrate/TMAO reductase-like tetraheme cytochrome c subunit